MRRSKAGQRALSKSWLPCEGYVPFAEFVDVSSRFTGKNLPKQKTLGNDSLRLSATPSAGSLDSDGLVIELPLVSLSVNPACDEQSMFTSHLVSRLFTVDAIAPAGISNSQLLVPGVSHLLLVSNTSLSVQGPGSTSQNATVPTVPFSLTLGYGSSWNGSVIFGGYFDKNRVFAEKWTPTEQTLAGNTTLLSTGKQSVGMVSFRKYTFEGVVPSWEDTQTTPATPFGHSSPGEVDPNHQDYCGANITISLNPGYADSTYSELQIAIPAGLTSSDKCVSTSDTVVLGKPFFQAAMVYIDDGGNIYFNAANRWALPVVLDAFNKDAMLNVPSQPATATQSATPTPTKSSLATLNELPSPMWMALLAVSALFFTA